VKFFSPEILPYEIGNVRSAMVKREQLTADDMHDVARKLTITVLE
jgi:hypothetical protein|tara:strand:- start:900 stop:1034 length:135 start_codon:yes stop_codon:yes gene_type:complete